MQSVDSRLSCHCLGCRARATQLQLVRSSYGCGRQGSSSTDHAADALQQVIDTLAGCKSNMLQEVPFSPEAVLHDLYSLDQVVCQIAAGTWTTAVGSTEQMQAARFNAEDAAAGLHEWQEPDSGVGLIVPLVIDSMPA